MEAKTDAGSHRVFGCARRAASLAVAVALMSALAACGFKTDPKPPEDTAPVIPGRLSVERSLDGVQLRWNRAQRSADGEKLYDLAAFQVERAGAEGDFETVATLKVTDADRVRQDAEFSYTDTRAGLGRKLYRVRALTADGQQGPPLGPVAVTLTGPAEAGE